MASSTRDALVDAAVQLLDEGGPEAVTLREVGHRAGVSHNAPYKHFTGKEALLAAVAARELRRQGVAAAAATTLQSVLHGYVGWALTHPERFRLVFGSWSAGTEELAAAAQAARAALITLVADEQRAGRLPHGDPERLAALLQALAHGAVALALAGHLSPGGKGHASPGDLVDDLTGHLRAATQPGTKPAPRQPT
ncbi:MAG TPA: TetR/AcrR family transcriptional regulator [Streptosporangiaceae bacterium]|jgi:AcrR family transcriptional regulator|nr:TetR/AcrR family transcriptional regulator [Streptosporangiaceae bacterium]